MNIYEHHEVLGWFFLPEDKDNPEKWVPGILKWNPAKGAEIELMGGLFPGFYYEVEQSCKYSLSVRVSLADDISSIPAMFLQTTKGNRYSIFDAQRGNYSADRFPGRNNEEHWHSTQVYVGDHVVPEEKIFTKATFYIDELYYLVDDGRVLPSKRCQMEGLEQPGEKLESGTSLTPSMSLGMGSLQAGIFEGNTEDAHYSISLRQTPQFTRQQRYGVELAISFKASVHITLRNQEKVEDLAGRASDFVGNFAPIRDLMRLATFQRCGVSSINLEQKKDDSNDYSWPRELGFSDDQIPPPPVADGFMLIKSRFGEDARPYEFHESKKVIFTLNDISLENFLKERERLTRKDGAFDPWVILIGLCGYIPNYMEEYISQSFAAAEGFHKLCLDKGERYTDSNGQRRKYSLRKRLRELHSLLPQKVQEKLKLDVDEWAKHAVKARNHAAHGGSIGSGGSMTVSERYAVAKSVHLVIYLVLLNELGLSSEKVCNALKNHPDLLWMMHYCDEVRLMLETKQKRIYLLKLMQKRIQTMSGE
jgi:putative uncharacterized protein (fragment)